MTKFDSSGNFVKDQDIGKTFEENKDYDNALAAYRSAINLCKQNKELPPPNPYMRMAIIYRKLGQKENEIKILKQGIRDTAYPQARTKHAKLVERLNKLDVNNNFKYRTIKVNTPKDNSQDDMYKDWLKKDIISKKEFKEIQKNNKRQDKKSEVFLNKNSDLSNKKKSLFSWLLK